MFVIIPTRLTFFAEVSCVTGQTETGERVDSIQTGGSIQTGVRLAFINICRYKTQAFIMPHNSSIIMGSIWFAKKKEKEDCARVCLFIPVSQCCPVYPGAHMQTFCEPFL